MSGMMTAMPAWLEFGGPQGRGLWFARGWPGVLVIALVAASIGVSFLLYRRQSGLGAWARAGLGALRALVLILLIFLFLQPTIGVRRTSQSRQDVLVLVDTSKSMNVRDTRKRDEDIAEAGLATGALASEVGDAQRELVRAQLAMREAERQLAAGKRDQALESQQQARSAIRAARAVLAEIETETARRGRLILELDELASRQTRLRESLASMPEAGEGWAELARRQEALRDDVRAVGTRILPSPAVLTAKDRERLASTSRLELAKAVLSDPARSYLGRIRRAYDVHYYQFASTLEKVGRNGDGARESLSGLEARGESTHLASAIEQAVSDHAGSVGGLVVFTDGVGTGDGSPIEVARRMGERGIPIYPVAVGLPEPDDVSIESVIVQEVAFEGDTVPVRVQIRSRGYERRQTVLAAYLNGRRVAEEPVLLTGQPQFQDLFFDVKGTPNGGVQLEITVEPFADEATDRNNRVVRSLRVVDEKINVLYIEGSARWEYRYLRAILLRDPRLNVKFISSRARPELARSSKSYLARFPSEPEDAFGFDLVILGDVDPEFFRPEELASLEQLVRERGGSLLMLAGRRHAPADYGGTLVESMLPVKFEAAAEWDEIGEDVHPVVTPAGRHSMVTALGDTARKNDMLWARIKKMGRIPPVTDSKPGAVVLAELSDIGPRGKRCPMIAWQRYGTGKSMFIATDRLWRLRLKTGDKYHWRLWSQTIQFLTLSRLLGENRRVILETDRIVYRRGERVKLFANVVDESFHPVLAPAYQVFVRSTEDDAAGPVEVLLKPEPGRPGLFGGYFTPSEEGRYQVLAAEEHRPVANTAEFHVSALQKELKVTAVQQDELERIAAVSGGQCLSIRELPAIPALFDQRQRQATYVRQMSIWDTWPVVVAFIALTGVEWFLRRRNDLA